MKPGTLLAYWKEVGSSTFCGRGTTPLFLPRRCILAARLDATSPPVSPPAPAAKSVLNRAASGLMPLGVGGCSGGRKEHAGFKPAHACARARGWDLPRQRAIL